MGGREDVCPESSRYFASSRESISSSVINQASYFDRCECRCLAAILNYPDLWRGVVPFARVTCEENSPLSPLRRFGVKDKLIRAL